MELRQYWAVIRKWLWLIAIGVIIAGVASYVISQSMDPVYRATATIVVQDTSSPIPSYAYRQPAVAAHAELITKESVMEEVIAEVDLPYSPTELRDKISVGTSANSPLVKVSAHDSDPATAQQIANTTVTVYIQQNLESLQAAAQAFLGQIQTEINQTSARIDELKVKEASVGLTPEEAEELNSLQDDLDSLKTQRTLWNTELAQAMAAGGVSVGASAPLPTSPVSPRTLQNVIIACFLGLAVTTGGVFLKEYLDRSVKSPEDVSVSTGLSTLGAIPRFKAGLEKKGGLIAEANPTSSVAEAFRMLRTNIEFATLDKPAQTLMITGPGPAEGKTSVLANLAVTLAQTGKKVIVVDTDLRLSNLHQMFGLSNELGFSHLLLARQPDVAGYLQVDRGTGLKVLAAGPPPHNPADLLGSTRVSFLIEELKKHADIILFDTPPVLAVADAAILAPKADAVILVVNAGSTRPEELAAAAGMLTKGNARILGVVLNRVPR
ncbi:MAG: polysaccharide biosynthesis tyrosine autokinase [Chloroflexi bacterium]|nr:polysaccharide biosynthesis tyrosine autokinase [Chloroflexota bacterium]